MSHLTEENRKTIASMLAHNKKWIEIANAIGCDPTTIAKEVKHNMVISKEAKVKVIIKRNGSNKNGYWEIIK